jgi:hypothetical protein
MRLEGRGSLFGRRAGPSSSALPVIENRNSRVCLNRRRRTKWVRISSIRIGDSLRNDVQALHPKAISPIARMYIRTPVPEILIPSAASFAFYAVWSVYARALSKCLHAFVQTSHTPLASIGMRAASQVPEDSCPISRVLIYLFGHILDPFSMKRERLALCRDGFQYSYHRRAAAYRSQGRRYTNNRRLNRTRRLGPSLVFSLKLFSHICNTTNRKI